MTAFIHRRGVNSKQLQQLSDDAVSKSKRVPAFAKVRFIILDKSHQTHRHQQSVFFVLFASHQTRHQF